MMPRRNRSKLPTDPPTPRKPNPMAKALADAKYRPRKVPGKKRKYVETERERDARNAIHDPQGDGA
jgi:hypothetical protein